MSQEIRLTEKDYMQILTWFELAFAKEGKIQTPQDDLTMKKISAMVLKITPKKTLSKLPKMPTLMTLLWTSSSSQKDSRPRSRKAEETYLVDKSKELLLPEL